MFMIGEHPKLQKTLKLVQRVAPFKTTCLIMGESGTGKELVAKSIHHQSKRANRKFVTINCGAIPEDLLESELFGYVKGAFTGAYQDKKGLFEEAHGGTLFLDEIGEMPQSLQAKLLRVFQESEIRKVGGVAQISIDVRIISATLKDLYLEVEQKRFREDLFYRLNVITVKIPPLRERKSDIPALVAHFLKKHEKKHGLKEIDALVLKKFMQHHWPGNVRELENAVERAAVLSQYQERIELEHLSDTFKDRPPATGVNMSPLDTRENLSIKQRVKALEVDLIKKALLKTKGNRTHASRILEISHRSLLYKLKTYELSGFPHDMPPSS